MNALLLSAGLGTRLKPITDKIPKVMVEVAGRPVLEHLVFYLHKYEINNIIVNLHYKPLKIMEHFGSSVLYTYENELLGEEKTIKTLVENFPFISEEYLVVMNGDTLTDLDLKKMFGYSLGNSIQSMEKDTYTGIKILSPFYFKGNTKMTNYYDTESHWFDIGTHEGLERARKYYDKESNKMS